MDFSGGLIQSEQQAKYVLIALTSVLAFISIVVYIFGTQGSSKAIKPIPEEYKIRHLQEQPIR